jgi:hypothetical protein
MVLGGRHFLSGARNCVLPQSCKILIHSAGTNFVQAGKGSWMKLSENGSWRPTLPFRAGNFALLRSCKILIDSAVNWFFSDAFAMKRRLLNPEIAAMGIDPVRRCTSMFNGTIRNKKNRPNALEQCTKEHTENMKNVPKNNGTMERWGDGTMGRWKQLDNATHRSMIYWTHFL